MAVDQGLRDALGVRILNMLRQMTGQEPAFPGFDTSIYPGDRAMQVWWDTSPYSWAGYYLRAPCHSDETWMGNWRKLRDMGWGLALIYLGQQAPSSHSCGRQTLTAAQGTADGVDALYRMAELEKLPSGSILFLDVERIDPGQAAELRGMAVYLKSWFRELLNDGRYRPGLYCNVSNADNLLLAAQEVYNERNLGVVPPLWVAGGQQFHLARTPAESGRSYAQVWQGHLNVKRSRWNTNGSVVIDPIDQDVATTDNPSNVAAE